MTVIDPPAPATPDRPAGAPDAGPPGGARDASPPGVPVATRPARRTGLRDRVLEAVTLGAKAATVACAIDAVLHHDAPRLRG